MILHRALHQAATSWFGVGMDSENAPDQAERDLSYDAVHDELQAFLEEHDNLYV